MLNEIWIDTWYDSDKNYWHDLHRMWAQDEEWEAMVGWNEFGVVVKEEINQSKR